MVHPTIDIISIGEVLIDFIGHELNTSINRTKDYHRFLGGSPTNVAVNASRLGLKAVLVASCGNDGLGEYVIRKLNDNQVTTSQIKKVANVPTSVIFVSKSTNTPDFIAYRQADCQLYEEQLPDQLIANAKIFHTTCFALSKEPARTTILNGAKKAKKFGLQLSIDINYSEQIWPERAIAQQTLKEYLSNDPLVKISEDDCFRLFGEHKSERFIFNYFHELGASTICLTKGKDGVVMSDKKEGLITKKALEIAVIKDTTGAGDAFWTGFLYAQLNQKSWSESLDCAQKLAAIKLQSIGRLPDNTSLSELIK